MGSGLGDPAPIIQLGTNRCVTKFMSEINFINSARQGDIIELGIKAVHFGLP